VVGQTSERRAKAGGISRTPRQTAAIDEIELLRMLAFHIGTGKRQIAKLVGKLSSLRLRAQIVRLLHHLNATEQAIHRAATTDTERSARPSTSVKKRRAA
jgi:hypothetical protein